MGDTPQGIPLTWVVGGRGLIGHAILEAAHDAFVVPSIAWESDSGVQCSFESQAAIFAETAGSRPWRIYWAAGVSVISSPDDVIERDAQLFESFLDSLRDRLPGGHGVVTLVSSAGGIYGGSDGEIFTEKTEPRPISTYGAGKLRQEQSFIAWGSTVEPQLAIARLANVYGARQNLGKPQGLISHACAAARRGDPIEIFVPLHTRRHYVYETDVGVLLSAVADASVSLNLPLIKNVAGGPATSIREILDLVGEVHGQPLDIVETSPSSQRFHPVDVILDSVVAPEIDLITTVPIRGGIAAVYESIRTDGT